jgi:hypothetical protein
MPTETEVTALKMEILRFVDEVRSSRTRKWFGNDHSAFRCELGFLESPDEATLNSIKTDDAWQNRGVFTFLLAYLESLHGMKTIGIRNAGSESIQPILRKRGYIEYSDNDFIKRVSPDRLKIDLASVPNWQARILSYLYRRRFTRKQS